MADVLPGFEASAVTAIGAPRNTQGEIIDRLNAEINAAFADPAMKVRFAEMGGATLPGTSVEFVIAAENDKWAKVVTSLGLTPN